MKTHTSHNGRAAAPSDNGVGLRGRADGSAADSLARSAAAEQGAHLTTAQVLAWLEERTRAHDFQVDRIPITDMAGWSFDEETGNLRHHSGRFFTVEGMHVTIEDRAGGTAATTWSQPVICQPEVAILGLLVKEFGGVPHILMQAKMEPGNCNVVQLSPTVQATWSNYTGVHKGSPVKYVEYFAEAGKSTVLADVIQSEQGEWFHHKRNRNVIVQTWDEVPLHEDFCWLTLAQIGELLHRSNVINMDSRSALSCVPVERPDEGALHSDKEVLSWFAGARARYAVTSRLVPLRDVPDWRRTDTSVEHVREAYFRLVGVSVQAGSREVTSWTQPLLEPYAQDVAAFLACRVEGVLHVLAHARPEGGFANGVEIGPTVQYCPGDLARLPGSEPPLFADVVEAADEDAVLYSAIHSEEGGRFLNAENRYLVVDVGQHFDPPQDYRWVTPAQLSSLVGHGHYLGIQARTLLACLNASGVTTG
ncbi:NDP-hexose 2,3-dehydratase family protein [Streptomyces sp. NPDC050560]|uniref:NDP-hexose 2,3-dehydratase family protein n=1 Tax=Streptomyces sp. NPDC050560 TaxID=3365630 RepID=UPI0037A07DF1